MIGEDVVMPEQFVLGHTLIDIQHGLLFAIYDELLRAIDGGENSFQLDHVFSGLNAYVNLHFGQEEALMDEHAYPGIALHEAEHKILTEGVAALKNKLDAVQSAEAEKEIAKEIARFLYDWLTGHIAKVDRELCAFLAKRS